MSLALTPVSPGFLAPPSALSWSDAMLLADSMRIDDGISDWSVTAGGFALPLKNAGVLTLTPQTPGVL